MPLAAGTKLGPYDLNGVLGAGGMGEVYRARDPRLNRDVAIKVLPSSFSADNQRLRRFEQEAMAAAALNHPNILAVYDVGAQDGLPYIVSELLEGETLRARLHSGPLSLRKAIDYATQIARALAAAHDKGIVHRDLKPDNIFITRDGRIKLLDFGLAKLTQATPILNESETRTIQSEAGTVLGTVGYMSPEQVRGGTGDARSDLFAFGAVLYEMVSGKRAFQGPTPADTISSILHDEPPELTETNRNVPPALERVVRHCLEKGPEERFQSARDVAFDLEALTTISTGATAARKAVASSRRRTTLMAMVAVASLAALAAFVAGRYRNQSTAPTFRRITYERGTVIAARFAVDGNSVVYEAAWEGKPAQLFSTPTKGPEPRALDLQDAHLFAISHDGEAALGLGGRVSNHQSIIGATLARSPLGGGAPRQLLQDVAAADWSRGGSLAVARWVSGRMKLEYPVGKVLYETSGWISDVRISPDGEKVAFLDHPFYPDDRGWVTVIDKDGNKKKLSEGWEAEDGLAWTPDGKEVWFAATRAGIDRSLYAVTLSGKQRLVLSVPGSLRLFDIYSDGKVLLSAGHERVGMMGVTAGDSKARDLSWSGWTIAVAMSPDGKSVLFDEQSEFAGGNYTAAIRTMDGSPPVKLADGYPGGYSPDGKWVPVILPGDPSHVTVVPTGPGESKEIDVNGLVGLQQVNFLHDGKLVFIGAEQGHGTRCYIRDLQGGPNRPVTPEGVRSCEFSPDSRNVVATDAEGIKLFPLNGGGGRLIPDTAGMASIRWTDDHTILAFRQGTVPVQVMAIDVATGKKTPVRELAPGDMAGVSQMQTIVATADARAFAYSYGQTLSELYIVEGLK